MRRSYKSQLSLTEPWLDLEPAQHLRVISELLDKHPRINELILQDLQAGGELPEPQLQPGARGLDAEKVLRALVLKQIHGLTFRALHFHLHDSQTARAFCRIGFMDAIPSKSTLAAAIKSLRAETLEAINRLLILVAAQQGIESGSKVRVDCTMVKSNIHAPSDSSLLFDGVRVLTRLMQQARKLLGADRVPFPNRLRRAKRRYREIQTHTRNKKKRTKAYRDLLSVSEDVVKMGRLLYVILDQTTDEERLGTWSALDRLSKGLERFVPLVECVIDQTRRRVILGEKVHASEKIGSIFEVHTDILRKDHRETIYGHKICLSGGASSLILDCVILDGNPADSILAQKMVDRQGEIYDRVPRQIAFDGGFASKDNLKSIKDAGVEDVAFAKRRGLSIEEMTKSARVYRQLRNFRAGIEGMISFLKRSFGLDRCTWRSLASFHSYVWSSVLASNLVVLARHLLG